MSDARRLRRLHALRTIEEQNQASLLDAATAELRRLNEALNGARIRDGNGRDLLSSSVRSGELLDRIAGLEEAASAARASSVIKERLRRAEGEFRQIREQFLLKRLERSQAETLFRSAVQLEAQEAMRKGQIVLDEWHLRRSTQATKDAEARIGLTAGIFREPAEENSRSPK
jgi:hypothetical protein